MVKREFDYINGSTAVKPERKIQRKERNYEEYRKAKIRRQKLKKQEKLRKFRNMIQIAIVVLVLGSITIYRDGKVYSLKSDLKNVNKEIKILDAENEAIRVDLLKNSSLKNIENNAKNKIKMLENSEAKKIEIDLSTNHLGDLMNNK
jgi:cell division protein FtsL